MATATRRRAGDADAPRVAVVLSGAGARGAFQAGALAELIPWLEAQGATPTVWLGTSAGSINAALWGSHAHLGAEAAAEEVLAIWRRMSDADVYRPLLPFSLPRTALRYAAGALLGVGSGTPSLLDTAPLRQTAVDELRARQLAANVDAGLLDAVGVVATRMPGDPDDAIPGAASGRSVVFLHEHARSGYAGDPDRALDVVRGRVKADHVVASSAIPVAFPPVQVHGPRQAVGWYLDGGVRLNTPLHPAVGLGATRLVVVSATATTYAAPLPAPTSPSPDIADAAAQVLNAALADRTTEDLLALRRTNRLVAQASALGGAGRLTSGTGRPYRRIEFLTVSPPPGEMGRVAADVFARRTGGFGRVTEIDNWLLGQALRGAGDGVGRRELLSYLFFDPEYFAAGIEVGRQAARAALAAGWES
ncbi:MAG: patatin-like phospholipase family protein [Nocardioidaceae bacterium]